MSFATVDAAQPVEWIKAAFGQFQKAPVPFLLMGLIVLVIIGVCAFIPLLGGVISAALWIFWMAGFQSAARALDHGQTPGPAMLFAGFQGDRVVPLATVAALPVAIQLLAMVLGLVVAPLAALVALIGGFAAWLAWFHAVPLVMFAGREPIAAIQEGFAASVGNILPMLLLAVLNFVLALAGALALLVGLLVTIPVMLIGSYHGYKAIWAGAAASAAPPPPPAG